METYVDYFHFVTIAILLWLLRLLRKFTTSYASEKGKNVATKEDIAGITREIERVRYEYAEHHETITHQNRSLLEASSRKHQLKLAALDRRLDAHQQAYALWWKLLGAVHDEQRIGPVAVECERWWVENCLYLNPEARQKFNASIHCALTHRHLLRPHLDAAAARQNWEFIMGAGQAIVRGVELPSLGEDEYKPVSNISAGQQGA